jgi:hypothetical protein
MPESDWFRLPHYLRHNARRHEHLATLGLPLAGRSVLEVGAGVGDHTEFLLDRKCRVTSTDGRESLVELMRSRRPELPAYTWDVETEPPAELAPHEVAYVYGLLYHTNDPGSVIRRIASLTTQFMVLETCVGFGDGFEVNLVGEVLGDPTQAKSGTGCRPTRAWLMRELARHFAHAYVSRTQPWHEEFPLDWRRPDLHPADRLSRAVFVGSRFPMDERLLSPEVIDLHHRC